MPRLLMLIRSVNNFIHSVKLINMLVLCLSIQHYVSISPNATHWHSCIHLLKNCTSFQHRKHHLFSLFRWQLSRDSWSMSDQGLFQVLCHWTCPDELILWGNSVGNSSFCFQGTLRYCWWFRNPVNSPVEVGSWNRIIYRVLAPSQVVSRISEPSTVSHLRKRKIMDSKVTL